VTIDGLKKGKKEVDGKSTCCCESKFYILVVYTIVCSDGNECASRPCVNGGSCVDGNHMYTCVCPRRTPALTGLNCQDSTLPVRC